jgi:catechol 2,3-dioxygenase-like lactoylglutathione lyase family enzyme
MNFRDVWRAMMGGAFLGSAIAALLPAVAAEPGNPLQLRAHHITAAVADIDRAVKWYEQVLGFRLVERGTRNGGAFQFATLEIPGFGVALVQLAGAQPAPVTDKPLSPDWVHIVFSVPDPAVTYRELKARGADVYTRGPAPLPLSSFLLHDSEGNEIEIVAAPRVPTQGDTAQ